MPDENKKQKNKSRWEFDDYLDKKVYEDYEKFRNIFNRFINKISTNGRINFLSLYYLTKIAKESID